MILKDLNLQVEHEEDWLREENFESDYFDN